MTCETYREKYKKKYTNSSLILRHTIELPIRLPRWNDLLGMNRWSRRHIRRLIHAIVFISIPGASSSVIQTASLSKQQLMDLFAQEYYKTIRTKSSRISPAARSLLELIVPQ